jgi:preprotein translocase subunit SecF
MKRIYTILVLAIILVLGACETENNVDFKESLNIEEGFKNTFHSMNEMRDSLEKGEIQESIVHFNKAHDFFHEIDPLLKTKDQKLAQKLWDSVLYIEIEIENGLTEEHIDYMIELNSETINLLQEAMDVLKK